MKIYKQIKNRIVQIYEGVRFHLFETDRVIINWPDFDKGILLLVFAMLIVPGHLIWYVIQYSTENRVWFNEHYHDYRIFTTWVQIILTTLVFAITLLFKRNAQFRAFMGWFIPLYFGVLLIYSAHIVGVYSRAAVGGTLNILLIGFVLYKPKVIYSIMLIISMVIAYFCYKTATGQLAYAPLFSDALNQSEYYKNPFWIQSMAILYLPILLVSALFFEILLRQWRRREKCIEHLSQVDGLTQVDNRRYLTDQVQKLHQNQNITYAMIILDLDFFKKINDHYGHKAGDDVLRKVAEILKSVVRSHDLVGRLGGEEFIMILLNQHLEDALSVAERCRKMIESQNILLDDGISLKITASFGVAVYTSNQSMDEVSHLADQALYLSKARGRNQVSHYLEI